MTESTMMIGAQVSLPSGIIGRLKRQAVATIFSIMAARMTEPAVGDSTWASGNQVEQEERYLDRKGDEEGAECPELQLSLKAPSAAPFAVQHVECAPGFEEIAW